MIAPRLGYVPSPEDVRDHDFAISGVYGSSPKARKSIRVSPHIHVDQVGNSCTGNSVIIGGVQDLNAKQVELSVEAPHAIRKGDGSFERYADGTLVTEMRVPELLPPLSTLFQYTGGRLMWFRFSGVTIPPTGIPDEGSAYRLGIMWLRDIDNGGGAREEAAWPERPENLRRYPPAHVDQGDPLVTVRAYSRIRYEATEDADTLRDSCLAALEGFERGECSKPLGSMELTESFVATPEGGLMDVANPGKDVGGHAMPVGGYDEPNDALWFDNSWPKPQAVRVPVPYLAKRGRGGEFWVLNGLIYLPRMAA